MLPSRVLECPYCRNPVSETSEFCSSCSFSLELISKSMGVMPSISKNVNDGIGLLTSAEKKKITDEIESLQGQLPQVEIHIIIMGFTEELPLAAQLFWLHNRAGLHKGSDSGGNCRNAVIAYDNKNLRLAIMPGYGLEPFLSQDMLDSCLETGLPHIIRQDYGKGFILIIQELRKYLINALKQLPIATGIASCFEGEDLQTNDY